MNVRCKLSGKMKRLLYCYYTSNCRKDDRGKTKDKIQILEG
jgi:hypothetical protein